MIWATVICWKRAPLPWVAVVRARLYDGAPALHRRTFHWPFPRTPGRLDRAQRAATCLQPSTARWKGCGPGDSTRWSPRPCKRRDQRRRHRLHRPHRISGRARGHAARRDDAGGGGLRVALATTHLALADVPRAITRESLEDTLRILARRSAWRVRHRAAAHPRRGPRIPHAGESGHLGREEIDVIVPVLDRLRARGHRSARAAAGRHALHSGAARTVPTACSRCTTTRACRCSSTRASARRQHHARAARSSALRSITAPRSISPAPARPIRRSLAGRDRARHRIGTATTRYGRRRHTLNPMREPRPRKRFGQHFLIDGNYVRRIVDAIAPQPDDAMVEIGPGLAALTRPASRRVRACTSSRSTAISLRACVRVPAQSG